MRCLAAGAVRQGVAPGLTPWPGGPRPPLRVEPSFASIVMAIGLDPLMMVPLAGFAGSLAARLIP